jgi:bifunctional UDP-N-acetylglucosamine pyrophosphorylase/glucosamine-1-phosphate N-acetyltransferase
MAAAGTDAIDVVIMAAGKGTRMKSKLPKVLHRLAGRALVHHVLDTAAALGARSGVLITGHGAEAVEAACGAASGGNRGLPLQVVRQEPQLGTGHAVQQAVPVLPDDGVVVVLSGDVPLTQVDTLRALVACALATAWRLLTLDLPDPTGYGRMLRDGAGDDAQVLRIVEHKDATPEQRAVREIYSGIMAVPARLLKGWLARLDNHNAQKEYYLTDVVKFAVADGVPVRAHRIRRGAGGRRQQPAAAGRAGARLPAPAGEPADGAGRAYRGPGAFRCARAACSAARTWRSTSTACSTGRCRWAMMCRIGANCVIANATIAAGAVIHPFTHIDGEKAGVSVGEGALVGPFARLRPGAVLGPEVHIGNFVEVKNSTPGAWGQGQPPGLPRATPASASGSTTARAASRPTTTAPTSTAP